MKACTYKKFGSPDVLQLEDIEKPVPKDHEVLIKVRAASINSWDWDMLRGRPKAFRFIFGFAKPRYPILGADVAGIVENVGDKVTQFKPGDEVFGDLNEDNWGGFAEYTCARENSVINKPAGITFEQAASLPQAGLMALQGLRDKKMVQPGQQVLINGAGGGLGTIAVQLAKLFGAEVTGVDIGNKLDIVRELGADHVIDYTHEDFTKTGKQYDLILDVVANRPIADYKKALTPNGIFSMVGGTPSLIFKVMIGGPIISRVGDKHIGLMAYRTNKDLEELGTFVESGKIKTVIDKTFPLSQVPEAFRYFGENRFVGKVVITI